jgi:hypothetical protein
LLTCIVRAGSVWLSNGSTSTIGRIDGIDDALAVALPVCAYAAVAAIPKNGSPKTASVAAHASGRAILLMLRRCFTST